MYRHLIYIFTMYSKELIKGTLETVVLNLLAKHKRMYGYEIFSTVKKLTDEKILLKDGSLYPTLQKLTKQGLLTTEEEIVSGRKRKYYALTKSGVKRKKECQSEMQDFFNTMNSLLTLKLADS